MRAVETVLFLVVVATLVAASANRLRIPAPSLLVVAGVVIGLLPGVPTIRVTPELVSLVVLPPLLYASGEELPWRDLRATWRPVSVLAVGLVLASAAVVAGVALLVTPLPLGMALVLGTVLASTDPVAVTALGRRLALPPRVQVLVQAESLFNDATSLLLFRVAVSLAVAAGSLSAAATAGEFLLLVGGGVATGLVVALGVALIRRRTEDPVVESVTALVTPYAAYVLAESVHGSGVTAVVVASVVLGARSARLTSARVRLQVSAVSRTVVFLLESVVFGLIGLELPVLVRELSGHNTTWPFQALLLAGTLVVVRVLWVFPLSAVWQRRHAGGRPSWQVPAVVSWAGARGVVPLAAALSVPLATDAGGALPERDLLLLLTTAVIVITLVVQGFTLAPLVRRAGIAVSPADARQEQAYADAQTARASLVELDRLAELEAVPESVVVRLHTLLDARITRAEQALNSDGDPDESDRLTYREVRRQLLVVESAELHRLHETGAISDATRRRMQRLLDLEETRLGEDEH